MNYDMDIIRDMILQLMNKHKIPGHTYDINQIESIHITGKPDRLKVESVLRNGDSFELKLTQTFLRSEYNVISREKKLNNIGI